MPRIPVYQQRELASAAVGTPGVDPSGGILAGAAQQNFSEIENASVADDRFQAGLTEQRLAQATQNLASEAADVQQQLAQKNYYQALIEQKRQKKINELNVAGYAAIARTELDDFNKQIKKSMDSNPKEARDEYAKLSKDYIDQFVEKHELKKKGLEQDFRAALVPGLESSAKDIIDWSYKQETDLARSNGDNVNALYVNRVGMLKGSVSETIAGYVKLQNEYLEQAAPQIKDAWSAPDANAKISGTLKGMTKALFHTLTSEANVPDGIPGLVHLDQVEKELQRGAFDQDLDADERNTLQRSINTMRTSREAQVTTALIDKHVGAQFAIETFKSQALADPNQRENPRTWSTMLQRLGTERARISQEMKDVDNPQSPSYIPYEKIRAKAKTALAAELTRVDTGVNFAEQRLDHIDRKAESAANKAASLALKKAGEAIAQEKAEVRRDNAQTLFDIENKMFDLKPLFDHPQGNSGQIKTATSAILGELTNAHMQGKITDSTYISKVNDLRHLSGLAAEANPGFADWFGIGKGIAKVGARLRGQDPDLSKDPNYIRGTQEFDKAFGKIREKQTAFNEFIKTPKTDKQKLAFVNSLNESVLKFEKAGRAMGPVEWQAARIDARAAAAGAK